MSSQLAPNSPKINLVWGLLETPFCFCYFWHLSTLVFVHAEIIAEMDKAVAVGFVIARPSR